MNIAVPKETVAGEKRVALVPDAVPPQKARDLKLAQKVGLLLQVRLEGLGRLEGVDLPQGLHRLPA